MGLYEYPAPLHYVRLRPERAVHGKKPVSLSDVSMLFMGLAKQGDPEGNPIVRMLKTGRVLAVELS